ncbi:MAG: hypothetical protein IKV21_03605 [Clostridia bacterium]|nr:hypothetical protein [Clostridia bacterium]
MKKISKKVIVTAAVLLVAVLIITAAVLSGKSGGVVFTDSSGKEIATVKYNGKEKKINPADEGYYDYISIALEEAIAFYYEKNKGVTQNAADYFFENVSVVKTCFESSHFEKIKKSFASSALEEDTPYAAVMVDSKGKVLAVYGYRGDGSTVYSLYKTYAGSSIKPLSVYAPAIDRGVVNWSSPVKDAPVKKVKTENEGERDWPSNASGTYTYEDMLVCDAVYKSINTVAVRVLQQTNIRRSMKILNEKLGMSLASENKILLTESEEEIYGNIALGYLVDGVSPLEMAGYYQIFKTRKRY